MKIERGIHRNGLLVGIVYQRKVHNNFDNKDYSQIIISFLAFYVCISWVRMNKNYIKLKRGCKMSNYDGKIELPQMYNRQGGEQYLSSDKPDTYLWLAEENTKKAKKIERLQEQIKEANTVICGLYHLTIDKKAASGVVCDYLVKYGKPFETESGV